MDVRGWLERLGLGQYADKFAANHIDATLLRTLTAEDLRELGVVSLGHRKRLLAAVAALEQAPAAAPTAEAERRQVAVLFADLCGFTELSAQIGAENVRVIVEGFLARADEIVAEYGGSVDKHIGDAVMALFGAPVAHEDDCWRAVAAADALQRSMPALSARFGKPLGTHVGIALGEVVAGEVGGSVRRDYTVLGDTVNLAARLVAIAGPGEVLLSDAGVRVLSGRARVVDAGMRELKGIAERQRVWRVEDLGGSGPVGRLPFVGREVELAQAMAVVDAANPGAMLHLHGEAGIGKSRLLSEILAAAEKRGFLRVMARNLDFGTARTETPSRVIAAALEQQSPDWLEAKTVDVGSRAALLDVLERPMPAELAVPYAAMEDAKRAALRIEAIVGLVKAVAETRPLAIAIEDLHWASAATGGLVRALAQATARSRVLLLTTSRPQGDPISASFRREIGGALASIELGPLRPEAARQLAITASNAADRAAAERFAARSGGNPLFLEQLALNAAEVEAAPLPGSIRALVQARLDRLLRSDRAALQAASVLGQRFPLPALRALIEEPAYDPRPLVDAGLAVHDGNYLMFSHALIQEATYASLLSDSARRLHRLAADWYGDSEPDLRAEHLDRAGDPAAAAAYRVASERLRESGQIALALDRAKRGLELAGESDQFVPLSLLAGHLMLDLGMPHEALTRFRNVLALAGDDAQLAEAEFGLAAAMRITDDLAGADQAVQRAQAAAERSGHIELESRCHHLRGNLLFPLGRVDDCMAEHRTALALAERAQSPELVARALGGLADAFYAQGRMRSMRDALERCISAARTAGAAGVEVANRPMAAFAENCMLRLDRARELAEQARLLALQAQNRRAELIALHGLMAAAIEADDPEAGMPHVERSQQIVADLGAWRFESENLIFAAQLEQAAGRPDVAARMAREAVSLCRDHAMAYLGSAVLGTGAALTDDASERDAWLEQGDALLSVPTLGHNHLFFRRHAIDASLKAGRPEEMRRHAHALRTFVAAEPNPFTDLVVQRALLLADVVDGRLTPAGRADLSRLAEQAMRTGYRQLAREMQTALQEEAPV
jgi:class 3 adenylate cyclase/tetratricopeptide (TPR) repeat protein